MSGDHLVETNNPTTMVTAVTIGAMMISMMIDPITIAVTGMIILVDIKTKKSMPQSVGATTVDLIMISNYQAWSQARL